MRPEGEGRAGGRVHGSKAYPPSPHIRKKEKQERVKSKNRAQGVEEDRKGKMTRVV